MLWLAVLFVLPFYVILSVALGTVHPIFLSPLPVWQPWYWSTEHVEDAVGKIVGPDAFLQPVFLRTFLYVAAATTLCIVIGYAVAYFVARYGGKRRALFLVLLIAPFWISYLMRMVAWQGLLQGDGYVNRLLTATHVFSEPYNWLQGRPITVILALVYGYIPYMILPLYGQLDRIGQNLLEAGRDLGASPLRTFFRVTLPLSKQAILAGTVIVALPMFGDYYTNDLVGSSKTSMIGNIIDDAVNSTGQGPEAAVFVLILMLILLVPLLYYLRSTAKAVGSA